MLCYVHKSTSDIINPRDLPSRRKRLQKRNNNSYQFSIRNHKLTFARLKVHCELYQTTLERKWKEVEIKLMMLGKCKKYAGVIKKKLHGFSPQANYATKQPPLACEVSPNFC
jgi:hypothetical protein